MPWFKVDDQFHSHPKVIQAGNAAVGLWLRCGTWAADHLTEGIVPKNVARQFGGPREIKALVSVGLWRELPDGYSFHDWQVYQPSGHEAAELRRKRAEAGRRGAAKRWQRSKPIANAMANPMANGQQTAWQNDAPIPIPSISSSLRTSSSSRNARETTTDVDLEAIAAALGDTVEYAATVAAQVLDGHTRVKAPTRYVLRSIHNEPERFRRHNLPSATSVRDLCDHGQDYRTCPHCRKATA